MKAKRILTVILVLLAVSVKAEYVPLKVKLNVLERLVVASLLPKEASFANWKILNDLRNELYPTDQELKAVDMKPADNGGVMANWDAVPEKEITFGEAAEKIIIDALKKLDADEKLLPEHIG